ncbi:MAG: DEAD/DEAH box helicase [Candidatus Marsarchaeota archaeon]|nr:DEAD/DEAH box helicase [Candidatus Marsarchaeota archaeon]MCL5117351.1 DEAD/DEAH box helicase [Candidatus Marsarchaeota archaeon]
MDYDRQNTDGSEVVNYYPTNEIKKHLEKIKELTKKEYRDKRNKYPQHNLFQKRPKDFNGLPKKVREVLNKKRIYNLQPIQINALNSEIFNGKNGLILAPTSSGKTLIAEIITLKQIMVNCGKVVFLEPLRALANQKVEEFEAYFDLDIRATIFTGEEGGNPSTSDVIIATNEKFAYSLRRKAEWIKDVKLLVVDDFDIFNEDIRGSTIEDIITTVLYYYPSIQILMLTATVSNSSEIVKWINGILIEETSRPVPLNYIISIPNPDYIPKDSYPNIKFIYTEPMEDIYSKANRQTLIYCSTRNLTQAVSFKIKNARKYTSTPDVKQYWKKLHYKIGKLSKASEDKVTKALHAVIEGRVSFHHAGLSKDQRKLVEELYKEKTINVIASTSTLLRGINLPVDTVLLYDGIGTKERELKVSEFKQIAGRAGRLGITKMSEGSVIIRLKQGDESKIDEIISKYIIGPPEPLISRLDFNLYQSIIGWVGDTGIKIEDLSAIFVRTLFASQNSSFGISQLLNYVGEYPDIFQIESNTVYLTDLGKLCFRTFLSKEIIIRLKEWLLKPEIKSFLKIISSSKELENLLGKRDISVYDILLKWLKSSIFDFEHMDISIGIGDKEAIIKYVGLVATALRSIAGDYNINITKELWVLGLPNCIKLGLDPKKYGELSTFYGTGRISRRGIEHLYSSKIRKIKTIIDKDVKTIQNGLGNDSFRQAIMIKNKSLQILERDKYFSGKRIADFVHCPLSFLLKEYKLTFEPDEYIKIATLNGTKIHKLIKTFNDSFLLGQNAESKMEDILKRNNISEEVVITACKNYASYIISFTEKPSKSEVNIMSDKLRINGKIDAIIERIDKNTILEYKSGKKEERNEMDMAQAASYALICGELYKKPCDAVVVYLNQKKEEIVSPEDQQATLEAITLAHELFKNQPETVEGLSDLCICKDRAHSCICNYFFKAMQSSR